MKNSPCLFQLYSNCILCLSLYLSFVQINLQFYQLPQFSSILSYICQMKIFSFIRIYLHLVFQLYSNSICMLIIVSEFFSKIFKFIKYLIISSIYHMYVISKSLVLYEYVSTSYANYILFFCMPFIVSEDFFQTNLQFYKLSQVSLNMIIHMLEENLNFK